MLSKISMLIGKSEYKCFQTKICGTVILRIVIQSIRNEKNPYMDSAVLEDWWTIPSYVRYHICFENPFMSEIQAGKFYVLLNSLLGTSPHPTTTSADSAADFFL
jgi:hypothetical protein